MGPGSRATLDRLASRWGRLETWAADGEARPAPGAGLLAWSERVGARAKAQGWRPQWLAWQELRAGADELSEDDLPGALYGAGQDLAVAEKAAQAAGYSVPAGWEAATDIARHPDDSPQAEAYRAPGKAAADAAQVLRVALTPPQAKGSGWLLAVKLGGAAAVLGLLALGAREAARVVRAVR